jgi:hypothetical protein
LSRSFIYAKIKEENYLFREIYRSYYFSPIFSDCSALVAEIMGSFTDILQTSNRRFSKLTAKPFKFLQSGEELTEDFKLLAKVVYDLGKLSEKNSDAKEGGN